MRIPPHTKTVAKVAIAAVAIWWVSRDVRLDELVASWVDADLVLLSVAVAVFMLTPVMQGVRLRRLLAAQGTAIGMGESIHLAFAGNFMNFAVPVGSTTGDLFKAAYLGRRTEHSWEAVATTFIDRVIGVATLVLTVTLIALVSGTNSPLAPLRGVLVTLSTGLFAGVAALRWAPALTDDRRWPGWVPAREALLRTMKTARSIASSPGLVSLAILDTMVIQIAASVSFLCAALALGFLITPEDWLGLYAFFSSGEIIKALPGPPQGLGTLEAAYGVFFREWAAPAQIVSAALAIRAINLICSLPGIVLAVGSASLFKGSALHSIPVSTNER